MAGGAREGVRRKGAGTRAGPRTGARERLRHLAPGILGVLVFGLVGLWDMARGLELWMWYCFSGSAIGAGILAWMYLADARVPRYLLATVVVALLLHYGGGSLGQPDAEATSYLGVSGINGAYHSFTWWDHLTHLVGIAAAAMAFAYLVDMASLRKGVRLPAWFVVAFAFLAAVAAGVGVELYEYGGRTWFQTIDQGGYRNTAEDLLWNIGGAALGAAAATLINFLWLRRDLEARWLESARREALRFRLGPLELTLGVATTLLLAIVLSLGTLADVLDFLLRGAPPPETAADLAAYDRALGRLVAFTVAGFLAAAAFLAVAGTVLRRGAPEARPE